MTIEIGFTDELVNTQFAPLAVLCAHYQQNHVLKPLEKVQIPVKRRDFSPTDKLIQTLVSILAHGGPLYEVNTRRWSARPRCCPTRLPTQRPRPCYPRQPPR